MELISLFGLLNIEAKPGEALVLQSRTCVRSQGGFDTFSQSREAQPSTYEAEAETTRERERDDATYNVFGNLVRAYCVGARARVRVLFLIGCRVPRRRPYLLVPGIV